MTLDRPRLAVRKVPHADLAASMFVEGSALFSEEERLELAPRTLRYMTGETPLAAFDREVRHVVVAAAIQVLASAVKHAAGAATARRLTLLSRDMPELSNTGGVTVNPEHEGTRYALARLAELGVAVGAIGVEGSRPVLLVPEPHREVDHGVDPHR